MERLDDLIEQLQMKPEQGQIWLARQRVFLMQLPAFAALRRELLAEVGGARAKRLLARMGYVAGSSDAKLARELRGDEDDQAFLAGPGLHALQGIVRVETLSMELDVEAGHHYVEQLWHDSIEADAHLLNEGLSAEPVCWMQIGHAAGFNSAFFGRSIMFKEVECRGMGHPHCRIIGKPLEDWEGETDPLGMFSSTSFMNTSMHTSDIPLSEEAPDLVGTAPSFVTACQQIEKVARSNVTVLFLGETGVGKERFAKMLHKISDRVDKPFIAVNCAALPESLIESELFGVEKGAFTGASQARPGRFERADGGTLFLDEIGTLTAVAQEKLLRVLQEREVERLGGVRTRKIDVRVVAATNADLAEEVKAGRFRADLYYRINVIPIRIPPLRERAADIPLLIRYFIQRFSVRHNRNTVGLTRSAIRGLLQHSYPGNIRELENMIERGVVLANDGEPIALTDLFLDAGPLLGDTTFNEEKTLELMDEWLLTGSLETVVEKLVARAMIRADGNLSQAARLLGVSRRQLEYRVKNKAVPHASTQR